MRPDMDKVIVERPRRGAEWEEPGRRRAAQRDRQDPESAPLRESMGGRRKTKMLNENLAPLRRFLLKNVGRPWDKVRSEIAEHVRPTSAVQAHVLQHLRDYVEEHPIVVDGIAYRVERGGFRPIADVKRRYRALYVCPRTGLLKVAEMPKRKKPRHPPPRAVRLHDLACAVLVKGCWHEATMSRAPSPLLPSSYPIRDAVLGEVYTDGPLRALYGPASRTSGPRSASPATSATCGSGSSGSAGRPRRRSTTRPSCIVTSGARSSARRSAGCARRSGRCSSSRSSTNCSPASSTAATASRACGS